MSDSLLETIQKIVSDQLRSIRLPELAEVTAIHPHSSASDSDNYACTIKMRNSGTELKSVPFATPKIGVTSIPDVGDLVMVQFLYGDINAPVITGCFYNEQDRPPLNEQGDIMVQLPLNKRDSEGVSLKIVSESPQVFELRVGKSVTVKLTNDDPAVKIDVSDGNAVLSIDVDGSIKIESLMSVSVKGLGVKLESDADFDIKANGNVNIKGAMINLN